MNFGPGEKRNQEDEEVTTQDENSQAEDYQSRVDEGLTGVMDSDEDDG